MAQHWRELGNEVSDDLRLSWHGMAEAFGHAMLDGMGLAQAGGDKDNIWRALQLPTGTGKTQGAALYAAMLAEKNRQGGPDQPRSGILFVTALIDEANKFAATVNELAGIECAAARHSDNKTSVSSGAITGYDVLAITHQAYLAALGHELEGEDYGRLPEYLAVNSGRRMLTIIDESISNLVRTGSVSEQDLLLLLAGATREVREEYPWLYNDLDQLCDAISKMDGPRDEPVGPAQLWREGHPAPEWQVQKSSLNSFGVALKANLRSLTAKGSQTASWFTEQINRSIETYNDLCDGEGIVFEKYGRLHVGSSRLILPDDIPGPVILDATATQEPIWTLLGTKVQITPAVPEVRSYANLAVHIARVEGVGKEAMVRRGPSVVRKALASLPPKAEDEETFVCVHKDLETKLSAEKPLPDDVHIDHWGNIDGRNDWKDCARAVLVGLSFPPLEWPDMARQAARGAKHVANEIDQLNIGPAVRFMVSNGELQDARITATIVQAINRIRCRKVIDAEGNCPTAEAFITLPDHDQGRRIIERLMTELPGVKIDKWAFEPDGTGASDHAHFKRFEVAVQSLSAGMHLVDDVARQAGLSVNQTRSVKRQLNKADGKGASELINRAGVRYEPGGRGRGNGSYLIVQEFSDN